MRCWIAAPLFVAVSLFWAGCSTQLTRADLENVPTATEASNFFGTIPLIYGNDSLPLDNDLQRAYTAAADPGLFPRSSCHGTAEILAEVRQNAPASAWSLGATLIPFWPALPVDETWTYRLDAKIYCNGTLVNSIEFTEEQNIRTFWYGILRSDLVNDASSEMHRKLVQRLAFELNNRPADLNSASDF